MTDTCWDCLIVGGGPAGLTAAIHLAWHDRRVLLVDRRTGPLHFTLERLHNVPGMPGATGLEIQKTLRQQAEALGAVVVRADVQHAGGMLGQFELSGANGESWTSRTVLLATGVARHHPTIDGDYRPCFRYAGKGNLYYCPDCEAPELQGRPTIVIGVGSANGAAGMAMGLTRYTSDLRVLVTSDTTLSPHRAADLESRGIPVTSGRIASLQGEKGQLSALVLSDGRVLEAGAFFVSGPAVGRVDLAQQLGVELTERGSHAQPASQRGDTNVPGVWVAGDLRPMSQQVAVAMGTGNIAALMIDQFLRQRG